jgi:hypothetical protein
MQVKRVLDVFFMIIVITKNYEAEDV